MTGLGGIEAVSVVVMFPKGFTPEIYKRALFRGLGRRRWCGLVHRVVARSW